MHSNHMGVLYLGIFFSFLVIFLINVAWIILNLGYWATSGLQEWLGGLNLVESVYYSMYFSILFILPPVIVCSPVSINSIFHISYSDPSKYFLINSPL